MASTETRPVASIIVGSRFRKVTGDIHALAKSIADIGLLHPIAVTPDRRLIAGARRLMAFKYLGLSEIPVHVVDLDEIVRGEFAENVHRKNFLPSELDAIGQEISRLEAERARARQGTRRDLVENCHDVEFGKTRDKVATQLGTSGRNLDKIRYVMRAAEDDPERFGKYAKEMDETENVDRAYKQVQGQLNLDAKKNRPIVCPEGKFATIVCDPPWPIDKIRMEVNSDEPEMDYETWTEEELPQRLRELGRFIDSKAADKCILWFWTTVKFHRAAEDAVEQWGWNRLPVWHLAQDYRNATGRPPEMELRGRRDRPTRRSRIPHYSGFPALLQRNEPRALPQTGGVLRPGPKSIACAATRHVQSSTDRRVRETRERD